MHDKLSDAGDVKDNFVDEMTTGDKLEIALAVSGSLTLIMRDCLIRRQDH